MECDDESSEDEEDGADDMLAEDEIDAAAATAAMDRNLLDPLRQAGVDVPQRRLTRQQAWRLAHASGLSSAPEDEMVDPWDA